MRRRKDFQALQMPPLLGNSGYEQVSTGLCKHLLPGPSAQEKSSYPKVKLTSNSLSVFAVDLRTDQRTSKLVQVSLPSCCCPM